MAEPSGIGSIRAGNAPCIGSSGSRECSPLAGLPLAGFGATGRGVSSVIFIFDDCFQFFEYEIGRSLRVLVVLVVLVVSAPIRAERLAMAARPAVRTL